MTIGTPRSGTARCVICGTPEKRHADQDHAFRANEHTALARKKKPSSGRISGSFSETEVRVLDRVLETIRAGGGARELDVLARNPAFGKLAKMFRGWAARGES